MECPMLNMVARIALTAMMALSCEVVMAGDALLLLDPAHDSLGDNGLPKGWQTLRFQSVTKPTDYSIGIDGDGMALIASSQASASGLYREIDLDLTEYPLITWEWKVANLIERSDGTTKNGDDYPARIIVAFHYDPTHASVIKRAKYELVRLIYGRYPPGSALLYVWDNRLPVETVLDNPNTNWARMIIVETSALRVNQWITERRNVLEDYARAFGNNPPRLKFVGIMTDTDDTGGQAVAYYRRLMLQKSGSRGVR